MIIVVRYLNIALLLLSLLVLQVTSACVRLEKKDTTVVDFLGQLVQVQNKAMQLKSTQLKEYEKKLDLIWTKQAKLEQVAIPAKEWLELQLKYAEAAGWPHETSQVIADLGKLKNDSYEVVKLTFAVQSARNYYTVIDIYDVSAGKVSPYANLQRDLKDMEELALKEGNMLAEQINLAATYLDKVLKSAESITYKKAGANIFRMRGPLGLNENMNLVIAEWLYYSDSGRVEPSDTLSQRLHQVLNCEYIP